jgi:hypothetical protein
MVYGDINNTAATTPFNCPGYSSPNGTLSFVASNQSQLFPTTSTISGYNQQFSHQYLPNQPAFSQEYASTLPLNEDTSQPDGLMASTSQQLINDPCAHLIQVLLCYHQVWTF